MKQVLTLIYATVVCLGLQAQNKTYYVSPSGNDSADGLSKKTAWASLDKVNSIVFQPGDKILFQGGGEWKGQLKPQGNGATDKPITMGAYGVGRPIINMEDAEGACIRLENQSWWTIEGMECTSGFQPKEGIGRQGIVAVVKGEGNSEHITVRDNYIHDIYGMLGGSGEFTGYNSAAILVQIQGGRYLSDANRTMSDVLIEGNRIERVDKCGIISRGCKTGLRVRHNWMDNLGGDGIFCGGCDRGIIEYNEVHRSCLRSGYQDLDYGMDWWPHVAAIWIQHAEETVMQYNAVYNTGRQPGNGDGFAYDFDFYCKRCVCQYNYSKENAGFMLLMNRTFENVSRYNISENDQTHLVQMQCDITDRNIFYNNVFYIDHGTVDLDFFCGDGNTADRKKLGAVYYNNIFYAATQSHFRTCFSHGPVLTRKFDETQKIAQGAPDNLFYHNCYFGPWKNGLPNDPEALVADPQFVAAGKSGLGSEGPGNVPAILASLKGFMLKETSPCINTGIIVPLAGDRDFYGNALTDGHPDFGAFEALGTGVYKDDAKVAGVDDAYWKESEFCWAKWNFPLTLDAEKCAEDQVITITPLEPVSADAKGTISWTNAQGKTTTCVIEKQKSRNEFVIKAPKATKEEMLTNPVHVKIDMYGKTQEWNIPF